MSHVTVFYSWQSDLPAEVGKDLVARALGEATQRIAEDTKIVFRPQVDQDTEDVPGSPDVSAEILGKIDLCSVFVADVTLTYRRQSGPARSAPNPNVLIELGYAVKGHGWPRVLQVLNTAHGRHRSSIRVCPSLESPAAARLT